MILGEKRYYESADVLHFIQWSVCLMVKWAHSICPVSVGIHHICFKPNNILINDRPYMTTVCIYEFSVARCSICSVCLCSAEERKSHTSRMAQGWINYRTILIFGWSISLNIIVGKKKMYDWKVNFQLIYLLSKLSYCHHRAFKR